MYLRVCRVHHHLPCILRFSTLACVVFLLHCVLATSTNTLPHQTPNPLGRYVLPVQYSEMGMKGDGSQSFMSEKNLVRGRIPDKWAVPVMRTKKREAGRAWNAVDGTESEGSAGTTGSREVDGYGEEDDHGICSSGMEICKEYPSWCCPMSHTCLLPIDSSSPHPICKAPPPPHENLLIRDFSKSNFVTPNDPSVFLVTCNKTEISCNGGEWCCPANSTCYVSTQGKGLCDNSTSSNNNNNNSNNNNTNICPAGFSQCTNMDGCCPTGVLCIPPNHCNIDCEVGDQTCGDGCCKVPLVCASDGKSCIPGSGVKFSSVTGVSRTIFISRSTSTITRSSSTVTVPTITPIATTPTKTKTVTLLVPLSLGVRGLEKVGCGALVGYVLGLIVVGWWFL